ncbi:MAG: DUF1887 family CARF protein [Trichlorobacter sp.]|nr:DUF1887 family CARF protein [Trichlorobacter sp.]
MNHVHVCLVSDQPIPNLTTVFQFQPDTVLLLYTDESKEKKDRLKAILRKYNKKVDERLILPFDMQNVIEVCEGVLKDYADAEVSLNITCGTKISILGAFQVFYSADKQIWYVNTDGQQLQQLSPEIKEIPISTKIKIRDYLAANGFEITDWQKDDQVILKRRELTEFLADIAVRKDYLIGEINYVVPDAEAPDLKLPKYIDFPKTPEMEELARLLEQHGMAKRADEHCISVDDKNVLLYLKGFWFEEYVYTLAKGIDADEVLLNVTGTWDTKGKKPPINEFDVMIAKGTQLALISCKTSNPNRAVKGEAEGVGKEYLYELDSLGDKALGLFGKRMLASARNIDNQYVKDRAKVMRIEIVDGKNIRTLKDKLKSWLAR